MRIENGDYFDDGVEIKLNFRSVDFCQWGVV